MSNRNKLILFVAVMAFLTAAMLAISCPANHDYDILDPAVRPVGAVTITPIVKSTNELDSIGHWLDEQVKAGSIKNETYYALRVAIIQARSTARIADVLERLEKRAYPEK